MIVLLDLEWIDSGRKYLTQLSAARVDEQWNEVETINRLVRPMPGCLRDRNHMALGGYMLEAFTNGVSVNDCMTDFAEWLIPDDTILVWARSNMRFMAELWTWLIGDTMPKMISAASKVRALCANRTDRDFGQPYELLADFGEHAPEPEHRASNDVEVMRRLFSHVGLSLKHFEKTPPMPPPPPRYTQRERNQKLIDKSQYNYVFLKGSEVFHRRSCKICLSAKSQTDILGSVYYETAAKSRRPCKLCNPVPFLVDAPVTDQELAQKEQRESEKLNRYTKEIIKTKMLTGEVIQIRRGHVLGWCHHKMHPGAVSKAIMDEHDCLGKNCPFLERNCQSPFWPAYEAQKRAKEERKEMIREEKRKKAIEATELQTLTENWRSYLEEMDSDMQIVRVTKDSPYAYRVFYVSDNAFADGNRYPDFLETLRYLHPYHRITLRHIRDVDGHFVTRSEYRERCRR